jgi:F-type H+-transporting ATPase subunit gamma
VASERELRNRIRSVKNIGQVTRALEAVSASKVRKAQAQVLATRAYAVKAWDILVNISSQGGVEDAMHPLLEVRSNVRTGAVLLLTSDRGLCGAFNTNIVRRTIEFTKAADWPTTLVTVGRKGRDLMYRAGQQISADFTVPDPPNVLDVTPIARTVIDDYLSGRVDVVYLAYMDFVNTLVQRPVVKRLLPLRPSMIEGQAMAEYLEDEPQSREQQLEYVYEPSPTAILNEVLPRFTELQVYQAVLESLASEHSARMVAMRNATENAEALVDELVLARNKARQANITSELLDIAGGAEALAKAMAAASIQ